MTQKKGKMDLNLLLGIIMLMFIGIIMVFSASSQMDLANHGNAYYTVTKQIMWYCVGVPMMMIIAQIDYTKTKRYSNWIVWSAIFLLGLVLAVGISVNGGKRWLGIGGMGIQPSEFAKLAIIIFFAKKLSVERKSLAGIKGVIHLVKRYAIIPAIIFGLIIIEPNMSTAIVILLIAFIMLFVAGLGKDVIFTSLLIGGVGSVALIVTSKYRLNRVLYVIDPWKDSTGHGWQAVNSLYAVGSGGLFGMGLGQGREKFGYLPMPQNDFIFSVTCEELGFIGAVALIAIFALFIFKMIKIAFTAPDKYGCYLVCGVTGWILVQLALHLLIAVSFFPVTGVPLPFISAGGSSTLFIMAAMGLVLNVSRYCSNKN
jgi:cell division protein FtsW